VPAAHYADFAVLRGDASDGLPGVSGIGAKTAAALVVRFGTVEAILEAAHNRSAGFPAGAAAKVLAAEDYLLAAPAVVRGRTDAPIDAIDDAVPPEPVDPDAVVSLADRYGIEPSFNRVLNGMAAARSAR